MADTLGAVNPLTYRGYVYDTETDLYYLQSRYYDSAVGRVINSDVFASTGQDLIGHNMFAYCGNNPVNRADNGGYFWDFILDVCSLVVSVVEVIQNPTDVNAWIGLALDCVDVAVPMVGGLGEMADAFNAARKTVDAVDDARDAAKVADIVDDSTDIAKIATTGSPNHIGQIGEQLAGIKPGPKTKIEINNRIRIPDKLTETTLTEVKNVKRISNTCQLRDFADYAKLTERNLVLFVRPTTKVSQTVLDAGWEIKYLW